MTLAWRRKKDPDEVLDYQVNWTDQLAGDTIASSTFIMPTGTLVKDSENHTDTKANVWLSGGTSGVSYLLLNRITTVALRSMDQTVKLKCKTR